MTARQGGAALLTAMLIVALVASLSAAAMWQQWRALEVESAERTRSQSLWVLTGVLDWARLILREDARTGGADHLGEPWAVPLQEARLSTFLAANQDGVTDSADGLPDVFLSGQIGDLQARLNLGNLVEGGAVSQTDLQAFGKLFDQLSLPAAELALLVSNLRLAQEPASQTPASVPVPLLAQRPDQLTWLGVSRRSQDALAPFVVLLPTRTTVNLNTASATVLAASVAGLDMAQAQRMVSTRQNGHFDTLADAAKAAGVAPQVFSDASHGVNSRYFEAHGRLRQEHSVVEEYSVLQRDGLEVKVLWRERGRRGPAERSLQ